MINNPFQGSGVALATPFLTNGALDLHSLRLIVENLVNNNIDFICVLGTTAETPTLNFEEREIIKNLVSSIVKGKIPLLLGVGLNNTQELCYNLQHDNYDGYDGLLMVCPFYNKPTQEGLYQHFKAAALVSPLPIVLYNIPGRTGVNLEPNNTLRLANDFNNIIAIKEASGNIQQIQYLIDHAPKGFDIISGDDAITFELLQKGAKGVISVIANAYPKQFSNMVHSIQNNQLKEAEQIHFLFRDLYPLMSQEGNPSGLKSLLYHLNLAQNKLRLPLVSVSQELDAKIKSYTQTIVL